MKRLIYVCAAAVLCSAPAQAQEILKTHPAGQGEKILTMKDVTVGRTTYPVAFSAQWADSDHYLFREGGAVKSASLTGEVSDYRPGDAAKRPSLPAGAANVTASGFGATAFTLGHSLYLTDAEGRQTAVAQSGDDDITYGQSVSRNEFAIGEGIYWSAKGTRLAFFRKDESLVTSFPLLDISTRTGSLVSIKYPMNGMDSERISLGVYDLATGNTVYMDVNDFGEDRYLTNISWSPDDRYVFIHVIDRAQHHMRLNMYNAATGKFVRTLLEEENDKWIEPYERLHFIEGTYQFIYSSDNRDGYKNFYLCDTLGTVRRLVNTDADLSYVTNNGRYLYYTSAEVSPAENHFYRVELRQNGKKEVSKVKVGAPQKLTQAQGWHRVQLSPDRKHFIDTYSSFNVPSVTELRSTDGKLVKTLGQASDPLKDYATGEIRFGKVKSADGKYDNHFRLLLPKDFDPARKYPVVLYVYGGPHTQLVQDSWLGSVRAWELLMAQKGYIVYVQDNRGTPNHGTDYEKAINRQCGQAEMADQMVGINWLRSLPYVDSERIGVHGWSYGGFMTISLITNYPDVFKVAAAGGPVIDWQWYEIMYGERYMDTMETNPEGFAKTSLINKAADLKGKLLILQGAIDDTVVWEHSLSFVQKCIENNVQLDYFPYPLSQHNVAGAWREHLMQKITDYFDANL